MKDYPEPEWNAINMNRKQGDTTFDICGWCKYACCGSCRYGCHLDSYCDLMKDYGEEREVKWDTKCRIKLLGQDDIVSIIKSKEYDIKDCQSQIKNTQEEISALKKLPNGKKPPLPDNRNNEHFKLKSTIYVFHEDKWNKGVVVPGYRTYDGCVSYVLEDYPDSKKGWGCGYGVPCVILGWEYEYFRKHLEEFKAWLKLCDRKYNGDSLPMDKYYLAMEKASPNKIRRSR